MIKLSQDQIDVFGRPNFTCIRLAGLLVSSGEYEKPEKTRAESEQAIVIHFLAGMLEKHGGKWREETEKAIDEMIVKTVKHKVLNDGSPSHAHPMTGDVKPIDGMV